MENVLSALEAPIRQSLEKLKQSPYFVFASATGAGAELGEVLWRIPGASSFLAGFHLPYSTAEVDQLIGYSPNSYCSEDTAIGLAVASFLKAQEFRPNDKSPIGLGLSAAVQTDRQRKGEDRLHIAVRTTWDLQVFSTTLTADTADPSRKQQGELASLHALNALFAACNLPQVSTPHSVEPSLQAVTTPDLDLNEACIIDRDGSLKEFRTEELRDVVILSGSFNPFHYGHDHVALAVQHWSGKKTYLEISATNAEKAEIANETLQQRTMQLRGRWPLIVHPNLPLFREKAELYRSDFAVGADTATRIIAPRFYAKGETGVQETLAVFRKYQLKIYVFSRQQGRQHSRNQGRLFTEYGDVFKQLPGNWNISSTSIRSNYVE